MMQLGVDGVFVGSGIFKSEDPLKRAKAIVAATTYYDKPEILAEVATGLGKAMDGIEIPTLPKEELLASRGWYASSPRSSGSSRCRAPSPSTFVLSSGSGARDPARAAADDLEASTASSSPAARARR